MDPRNWVVTLKQPTTVHDVLRHPVEGGIPASEKEAKRLFDNKLLVGEPERAAGVDDDDDEPEVPEDLKDLKLDELKAKALKDGVPLHDAKTKPTIIAAFVAHRASQG